MKIPGMYGVSSKGSKCYKVQTREISPWLEGSWERAFELATVLTVPRKGTLRAARYSSMTRGSGLGRTEVTGGDLCMVSLDWNIA